MSVAFTKEDSAETAAELLLPDRPVPTGPNLVTETGLALLRTQLRAAESAYDDANRIEDINERRRHAAVPYRDLRYFSERLRTAQLVAETGRTDAVGFGGTVTFERGDGRIVTYRIVGEDEADPKAGTLSFASPLARALMGKRVGEVAMLGNEELEVNKIG